MKLLKTILTLFVLSSPGVGQEVRKATSPNVTIEGINGPVDFGEMVILSAAYDQSNIPENLVDMSFNWTVMDEGKKKTVFTTDGGRQIAFAVGMRPRKIVVILDVNCLYEKKDKLKVVGADPAKPETREVITEATMSSPPPIFGEVVVGVGPPPLPNPNPNPNPGPSPAFPDGQFGLSKFAYDTFLANQTVSPTLKAKLASVLADKLEGIASKIVAVSDYKDLATILTDTKKANDEAFSSIPGLDLTQTVPIKDAMRKKIYELYHTGKLNSAADVSAAWKELSVGLRAIQ